MSTTRLPVANGVSNLAGVDAFQAHADRSMSRVEIDDGEPPETDEAYLYCYDCNDVYMHVFAGRRLAEDKVSKIAYVELLFRCFECEHERIWGTECFDGEEA